MKSDIRVFLCDNDNLRFFGEGPCRLLHLIEETGSLRAAAMSMGMAYTKALAIMRRAEKNLGFPLTARRFFTDRQNDRRKRRRRECPDTGSKGVFT